MKSESYSDNGEMSNKVGNRMDNEMPFIEKIQPNNFNPNCIKSKSHSDNDKDNNSNIKIGVGNKELQLDNLLEDLKWFDLHKRLGL